MKILSARLTVIPLLLLGAFAFPASAQHNKHDGNRDNPGKKEGQPQKRKKPQAPGQAKQPQATRQPQPPRHTARQSRDWQEQRGWQKQGAWQGHDSWDGGRALHWQTEHRTWEQRGGYGGYYIPRNSFRVYFGQEHWFRIRTRPVIYMGYPRFAYGGSSFMLVDPWPEDWDANWYESDDVYIDYDGGYYLFNRRHPGVAVTVLVVQ